MKQNRPLIIAMAIFAIVCVASLLISLWNYYELHKIGYVDTIRLFNEYKLKIDLEKNEEGTLGKLKSATDSLKTIHNLMVQKDPNDSANIRKVEMQIMRLSQMLDQEYSRSNKDINEKVWQRLNPDIDEFAKKQNMQLLIGANGMGTVLYGSRGKDYTDQIIKYVNKKYNED